MAEVTTWYLEMNSIDEFREKRESNGLIIIEAEVKNFRFNRDLYQLVGVDWEWTDKLSMSDDEWQAYAEADDLRTWVGYCKGSIVGYFELDFRMHGDVEIAYFGLAPDFVGKGFGGFLLSQAIKAAWSGRGVKRVWVHTCNQDHPNALRNYEARGLKVYKNETKKRDQHE